MSLYCPQCGSSDLRTAHLRPADLLHLVLLKYPVRCHACKLRGYAPYSVAMKLPKSHYHRRRNAEKRS